MPLSKAIGGKIQILILMEEGREPRRQLQYKKAEGKKGVGEETGESTLVWGTSQGGKVNLIRS